MVRRTNKKPNFIFMVAVLWFIALNFAIVAYAATGTPATVNGSGNIYDAEGNSVLTFTTSGQLSSAQDSISITDSVATATLVEDENGISNTLTITATPSKYYTKQSSGCGGSGATTYYYAATTTTTVTIKNPSAEKSVKVNSISGSTAEVTISEATPIMLAPGESFTITLVSSPDNDNDESVNTKTAKVTIAAELLSSNSLTLVSSTLTDYTITTSSGETFTAVKNSSNVTASVTAGSVLTLPTPPAVDGYVFYGWRVSNGTLVGGGKSLTINTDLSIVPVYLDSSRYASTNGAFTYTNSAGASSAGPFEVSGTRYLFWEDAVYAANTSGSTIVLVENYAFPATYADNGLTRAGKFVTGSDNALVYTLPSGVTFLAPYASGGTTVGSSTYIDESGNCASTYIHGNAAFVSNQNSGTITGILEPNTNVSYTLSIPSTVTVTVGGRFVVGGTIVSGTSATRGISGGTAGAHSNIDLDGQLNIASGGKLSSCGYILGDGDVNAASGAEIYQPFIILDHRDGHYVAHSKDDNIFPTNRYAMMNIQADIHMAHGSYMYGYVDLFTQYNDTLNFQARHNVEDPLIIGTTGISDCLIKLSGGSLDISYDPNTYTSVSSSHNASGYYSKVGRTTLDFSGGANFGSLSLSIVLPLLGEQNVSSANCVFPVPYNYDIILNSGNYSIDNSLMLLPGASMTVNYDAALTVTKGTFAVFDGLRDYAHYGSSVSKGTWYNFHYPSTSDLQKNGTLKGNGTANLTVNGTLTVNSGVNFGGTVQTTRTGAIITFNGNNSATASIGHNAAKKEMIGKTLVNAQAGQTTRTLPAKLFTKNGTITMAQGKSYTYLDSASHTIASYAYTLYTSAGTTTSESITETLNAAVLGTWKCNPCTYTNAVTNPATCTTPGVRTYTCSVCGHSYTEAIPATGHSEVSHSAQAPTCDAVGWNAYVTCANCNYTTYSEIPALGHNYVGVVTRESSCTAEGIKTYTCQNDNSHTYTESIPKADHNYESAKTEPSCTEEGYTTHTCTACGNSYTSDTIAALGHGWDAGIVTTEPTCTEAGVRTFTCGVCGETKTETISNTGHSYSVTDEKAATCEEDGYTVYTCAACGDTYTDTHLQTGHDWEDGVCQNDNSHQCPGHNFDPETDICSICKLGCNHESWTAGEVIDPTCTEDGYTVYTCDLCHKEKHDDIVPTAGHSWKDATCTTPKTCSACGATEGGTLDHTPGEAQKENEVLPTCVNGGSYDLVIRCTVCKEVLESTHCTTDATGSHTYGDWATTTEATYNSFAIQTRTCTVCQTATETQHPDSAKIGETAYPTLSQAVDQATEGSTITLLVDISGDCVISKALTVEKNGHTANIIAGDGYMADGDTTITIWKLFKLAGTSVKVEDGLHIFFYVNDADKKDGYVAHITRTKLVKDSSNNYTVETTETAEPIPSSAWSSYSGGQLWRFSYDGIAAKEMTDIVTVIIRDSSGKQVSAVATESIEGYALRTLEKIKDQQNLRNAVISMVNYGADAQTHFGYRTLETDHLANANLTGLSDAEMALDGKTVTATDHTKSDGSIGLGGTTVTAEANLYLTFYFKDITETKDNLTACISYTDHYNRTETITIPGSFFVSVKNSDGDTLYGPRVTGIAMADGRALITCELKDGDTTLATAVSSVESYAAYNLEHSANEALKAVCNNMINFVDYVKAYFDNPKA